MILIAFLLSIIIFIAIFGASAIYKIMFQYTPKGYVIKEHYANSKGGDEYKEFYDMVHNVYIDPEYKCHVAQSKIDKASEHSPAVVVQSKKYINRFCSDDGTDENVKVNELTDIDETDPDVYNKIYKEYCFGKFGILGNKQPLKSYTYGFNHNRQHNLNQIPVSRLPISRNHCRQLEDIIITNKQNQKKAHPTKPTTCLITVSPTDAYNECKDKFRESDINTVQLPQYRYHRSNDGKHYINDSSLEKLDANLENCRIVNDILCPSAKKIAKPDENSSIHKVLNSLNDNQVHTLCKRSHELDLICNKYDKNMLSQDSHEQTLLHNYNNEYHFLTPNELETVNQNIHLGKSGLRIKDEINMCYRKQQVDTICN